MGASQLAPASLITVWTACPAGGSVVYLGFGMDGMSVLPFALSLTLLWLCGRSEKCVFYWRVLTRRFSVVWWAFFVDWVLLLKKDQLVPCSSGCLYSYRQRLMTWLLQFSNIAWFLCCLNVYACGNYVGSVDAVFHLVEWSVGSLLNVSVSTQTLAHGVLFP